MVYMVYQVEICPETNRFHVQGYVEFKRSVRLGSAKKLIKILTAHLEPRQGSRSQAREYCMKEDSRAPGEDAGPWEFGEWSEGETKRSDLQTAIESIQNGKDWQFIVEENPACAIRYFKNLHAVWSSFNIKPRDGTTNVYNLYIYGDAGAGKTRFAHWLCGRQNIIPYSSYITGWWQDYLGQEWAIYDDFDGKPHMDIGHFKKICDRYPLAVPYKGGSTQYRASVNIFTSNIPPIEWYERVHWDAVKRRASHLLWWRSHSIICEACQGQCELVDLINEARAEWANVFDQ